MGWKALNEVWHETMHEVSTRVRWLNQVVKEKTREKDGLEHNEVVHSRVIAESETSQECTSGNCSGKAQRAEESTTRHLGNSDAVHKIGPW